ncbi:hypothetical protein ALON55S_08640 [Alishewanella longhuensis]
MRRFAVKAVFIHTTPVPVGALTSGRYRSRVDKGLVYTQMLIIGASLLLEISSQNAF